MDEAKKYLLSILSNHDTVVIGVSGGPDSMALLNLLLEMNLTIIVAHINHRTREECYKEANFVKKYCESKQVIFEYFEIEEYRNKKFSEEEGREKRYAFFRELVDKYHAKCLLTAHHGDDLVETILMRILRGSTLDGYAGIKRDSTWNGLRMIRPLLTASKKEIFTYVDYHHIPYVIDETNNLNNHLRNRLRHQMLPLLEQEDKHYYLKFLTFNETLQEGCNIIHKEVNVIYDTLKSNEGMLFALFRKLDLSLQKYVLQRYLQDVYKQNLKKITNKHLDLILSSIAKKKELDLPNYKCLRYSENIVLITDKKEEKPFRIKVVEKTILPNNDELIRLTQYTAKSNYEIHLNSKSIKMPLYLVSKSNGMKMSVKNLNGHRKVSDIMIDSKIDRWKREQIPILIDSNGEVLWILGVKKSKYDLEKNENYDIIYKYLKKGKNE